MFKLDKDKLKHSLGLSSLTPLIFETANYNFTEQFYIGVSLKTEIR